VTTIELGLVDLRELTHNTGSLLLDSANSRGDFYKRPTRRSTEVRASVA